MNPLLQHVLFMVFSLSQAEQWFTKVSGGEAVIVGGQRFAAHQWGKNLSRQQMGGVQGHIDAFFCYFFFFLQLAGWMEKTCMDSITSPSKHASQSQWCVYSPATSWPEESFFACWAAHLQEIVLEALTFWTALSTFLHTFHAKQCGCLCFMTF